MPVDKDTANRQWEICPGGGKKKVPAETSPDPLSGPARRFVGTESLLTALRSCAQCLARKDFETMVPIGDLEYGAYCFGTCRNAQVARWSARCIF
jgi:hypothetical protein